MHQGTETVYWETADSIFLSACPLFCIFRTLCGRSAQLCISVWLHRLESHFH